jgi:hypothetical protein
MIARVRLALVCLCCAPSAAHAQQAPGGALEAEGYVALSADEGAQQTLGGFRAYLERVRRDDLSLYRALDPPLDDLQWRDTIADVIFWTATGLAVAAVVTAIPIYTELRDQVGREPTIGLVIAGISTFVVGAIVQAIVRPTHGDLMALIDLHDQILGRR